MPRALALFLVTSLSLVSPSQADDCQGPPQDPRAVRAYSTLLLETAQALQQHTEWVSKPRLGGAKGLGCRGWNVVGGAEDPLDRVITAQPKLRAYVARKGSKVVVVFRGTKGDNGLQTLRNFLVDADTGRVPATFLPANVRGGVRVHAGFHGGWLRMRERVIKRVNTALSRGAREVFVTGHSLGGAMATLAALDLHFEIRRPVFLLTTGAPRAGNAAFASLVERRLRDPVRVVHHLDPIPRVPSGPDFRHAGRLLVLFETGRRVPTAKVSGRVQAKGLKHHDRALYAEILEKHLGFVRDGSAPTQNPQGRDFLRLAAEAEQASRLLGEQAEAVTDAQAAARERAEQAKQAAAERAQQARQAAAQRAQEAATNARGAAERARDAVRRRRRR